MHRNLLDINLFIYTTLPTLRLYFVTHWHSLFSVFLVFKFTTIFLSSGALAKDILFDKFSIADFCSVRHNPNKFASALSFRKKFGLCVGFLERLAMCMTFSVGFHYGLVIPFINVSTNPKIFSVTLSATVFLSFKLGLLFSIPIISSRNGFFSVNR